MGRLGAGHRQMHANTDGKSALPLNLDSTTSPKPSGTADAQSRGKRRTSWVSMTAQQDNSENRGLLRLLSKVYADEQRYVASTPKVDGFLTFNRGKIGKTR